MPEAAREIRKKVFIDEQKFTADFDDKDDISVHLVVFDENGTPVATCRIFKEGDQNFYVVGRLAVIKECRGKKVGSLLLGEAEKHIKEKGGTCIVLHAQQRVSDFYKKAGFVEFGSVTYDENCPHIYMKKIYLRKLKNRRQTSIKRLCSEERPWFYPRSFFLLVRFQLFVVYGDALWCD